MPLILPCGTVSRLTKRAGSRGASGTKRGNPAQPYATLNGMFSVPLVARLHVDLQRVASAACRIS
jgi:hypothetical protein